MTDELVGFTSQRAGLVAMTLLSLALSLFVAVLVASIVSSAWMRPDVPLGRSYWILTLVLTTPTLLLVLIAMIEPAIVIVLPIFGPIAAGWLTGALITVLVRAVRARVGATPGS